MLLILILIILCTVFLIAVGDFRLLKPSGIGKLE